MILTFTELDNYLKSFRLNESPVISRIPTKIEPFTIQKIQVNKYINEFWTSKQRQASSIHEISYRACFKPQLPRFFIDLLSLPKDIIYDPFTGRGTTIIEAALLERNVISNDINPISKLLTKPRLDLPQLNEIHDRLNQINFNQDLHADMDLSMFFHQKTESEIICLKNYLLEKRNRESEDHVDEWIQMVATNRLTGHSPGFFSVYTLPPNQAVSPEAQIKINKKRNQVPLYRNVKEIILNKSKSLLKDITPELRNRLKIISKQAQFYTLDARKTQDIQNNSVQLTVTSPPFLDIVQYSKDNWLRCWFNGINVDEVEKKITMAKTVQDWSDVMIEVFKELYRITRSGGWVAFEVGEVNKGKTQLEDYVIPIGIETGFQCFGVLINLQTFTKTSNIWGVNNNSLGTNTNRIVVFRKI